MEYENYDEVRAAVRLMFPENTGPKSHYKIETTGFDPDAWFRKDDHFTSLERAEKHLDEMSAGIDGQRVRIVKITTEVVGAVRELKK